MRNQPRGPGSGIPGVLLIRRWIKTTMRPLHESLAGRWFQRMADCVFDHPWAFSVPQLVVFAGCILYTATSLRFSTDRGDLVSAQERYRRNFLDMKQEFGLPDLLVVAVESERRDKNWQFMERLAVRLRAETNLITRVRFKGDLRLMGPKALLFLPEEVLEGLYHGLQTNRTLIHAFSQAGTLSAQFELVNRQFRRLRAGAGEEVGETSLARAVPTLQRVLDMASETVLAPANPVTPGIALVLGSGDGADRQGGYFAYAGGRIHVLTAEVTVKEREAAAIDRLRALVRETQAEVPGVNLGITGESVLRHDEMGRARVDTALASGISLVLTALILTFGYREILRPLIATFCLVIGIGFSLGFATLTVGRLNLLSLTMVPILIGLAIDFGVHLISRYEEEVRAGLSPRVAMRKALRFTGIGIFTSALTTAGAFFSMMLTDFQGIREMGLIAGAGLVICLIPMMTVLPVLLVRTQTRPSEHWGTAGNRIPRSPLIASLAVCWWGRPAVRGPVHRRTRIEQAFLKRPGLVLGVGLAFTVFACLRIHEVQFDFNLQNLQTRELPAVELEKKLIRTGSQSVLSCSVIADSLPEAEALERRIRQLPSVAGVTSLVRFLTEDQDRKLVLIRGIKQELRTVRLPELDPKPVDLEKLEHVLLDLHGYVGRAVAGLKARGTEPELMARLLSLRDSANRLRSLVALNAPETRARLTGFQQVLFHDLRDTITVIGEQNDQERLRWEDVPPFLRERYMSRSGRFMLQVHSKENLWHRDKQEAFVRELRTVYPDVTGSPVQFYESTSRLKNSFQKVAVYSFGIVGLLVLLHFRRVDAMMLTLLPLVLGYAWMLGLMGWFGLSFNPVNIASVALVVGIGVTNGVHVMNRFLEEADPVILTRSTGKAVVVSALTTMAGFGSLMVAKHQGIASLGAVMSIGTATCMAASLLFLPAILNLLGRMGWSLVSRRSPARSRQSGATRRPRGSTAG